MKKYTLIIVGLMLLPLTMYSQDRYLRIEGGQGTGGFASGYDGNVYYDNTTMNLGIILETEGYGREILTEDRIRKYYGLRYRKAQAATHSTILNGTERYRYDNLEIPLGIQIDWLSLFQNTIVAGTDVGISGAIPLKMEGERTGPDVLIPWHEKYERPWFLFGFQFGLYAGINIKDRVGIKYGGQFQYPFIPITASVPEGQTDPGYKAIVVVDKCWTISLQYKIYSD